MHGAPSVSHPVGRSFVGGCIVGFLWACGTAATLAWAWTAASGWRLLLAGAFALVPGAVATWAWWRQRPGTLAWDGARWTWASAASPLGLQGTLSVVLDLQQVLLVQWSSEGERRWFWLQPSPPGEQWVALRRAVYSRADADVPSGAEPPPSSTP
jgi:hypothetical protein